MTSALTTRRPTALDAHPARAGEPAKLANRIADELRRLIVNGQFADGDALRPTSELMAHFGVSRPTLRAALRILEGENLVRVTQGSRSGARIYKPTVGTAARVAGQTLQASGATLGDLYQAQLAVEPFAARLLAERRDSRDIVRLRAHLARMRAPMERGDAAEQNAFQARFHQLLIDLTGNKVLSLTAGLIASVLEQHHGRRVGRLSEEDRRHITPEFRSRGARSMSRLVGLIEAGDADAAESHWRAHLTNSTRYWMSIYDPHEFIDMLGSDPPPG
jgi:DNA-binding FadR family transcriptional regulator